MRIRSINQSMNKFVITCRISSRNIPEFRLVHVLRVVQTLVLAILIDCAKPLVLGIQRPPALSRGRPRAAILRPRRLVILHVEVANVEAAILGVIHPNLDMMTEVITNMSRPKIYILLMVGCGVTSKDIPVESCSNNLRNENNQAVPLSYAGLQRLDKRNGLSGNYVPRPLLA